MSASGWEALRPLPPSDPPALDEVVAGRYLDTPEGRCFVASREYPVNYHYGGFPIERGRLAPGRALSNLAGDPDLAHIHLGQACFIDTETTGLGGTGTYVFMVGIGHFTGDYFRIDQYFMEDYDQEPALLSVLAEELRGFTAVVSFNGRAFDLPLIETRFILARRRPPLSSHPHLDLLPCARRLWGLRLESCRLVALEEHILGETRVGDLPGHLVPERYFAFLRTGDPRLLVEVFDHNRQDVLSMLALAGAAAERIQAGLTDPLALGEMDALDRWALARVYRRQGLADAAVRAYRACLDATCPAQAVDRVGRECLGLLRRQRRMAEALDLAAELADAYPPRLWAMVEQAKFLEHHQRDYRRALEVVDRALGLVTTGTTGGPATAPGLPDPAAVTLEAALLHRRARLEQKRDRLDRRRDRPERGQHHGRRLIPPSASE